jgi:hypothetical protein
MSGGFTLKDNVIIIHRELTDLDLFVKDFLEVLKKHCKYLIVSGFVSIASGRTRGTEDVDVLIPKLPKELFEKLFLDLTENGFWCYQGEDSGELLSYVNDLQSIRFAKNDSMFPNMEVIPTDESRKAKFYEFLHPQKMQVEDFVFNVPPIEFEILYKEIILAGDKDLADAKHLRSFFKDILKEEKFLEYEPIIRGEL